MLLKRRKSVGEAIWLLLVYVAVARKSGKTSDAECAYKLSVSIEELLLWRGRLVRAGIIAIRPDFSGGIRIDLQFESDTASFFGALHGAQSWEHVLPRTTGTELVQ